METSGQLVRRDGIVLDTRNTTITAGARHDENGRRIYRALAYDTTTIDRHGTTIDNSAFREPTEAGIPIILFHDADRFPVGRVIEWSISDQGPVAGFVFADTDEAREAELLVATGFLNGVSIGFLGWEAERRDGIPTYTDVEVVELSLTPTPSSRGALISLERSIRSLEATIEGDVTTSEATEIETGTDTAADTTDGDAHCECCRRFKTGEPVEDTPADEPSDDAATVADGENRQARLKSLLNRLR